MAVDEKTTILTADTELGGAKEPVDPRLYVCYENSLSEHMLSGIQRLGRPTADDVPDIPIADSHVSHSHGFFDTKEGFTFYTAESTTNGIRRNGRDLLPGETVELKDGDEFIIPASDDGNGTDIMIVYASTAGRVNLWRNLYKASYDYLTELPGRDAFINWWNKKSTDAEWQDAAFFILDVDSFKGINDKYGHSTGDDVLRHTADLLKSKVGSADQLCRWGGDEFVGVVKGTPEKVSFILGDVRDALRGREISFIAYTVSIGYVNLKDVESRKDIKSIVAMADDALY